MTDLIRHAFLPTCDYCRQRDAGWDYRFDREADKWLVEPASHGGLCEECARALMPRPSRDYD